MSKKGNPFLNFIWLDKKRRAKNISFLLSVVLVLFATGVGYANSLFEMLTTGEDLSTTIVTGVPVVDGGDEKLQIDNVNPDEDEDIDDEEMDKVISGSVREFVYNWYHNDIEPMRSDYVINLLLIGLDSRTGLQYGGRSDTLILLSLNTMTKKINMTSFFRDTYTNIESGGSNSYNKINASYAKGGADCLIETLERDFKIDIDYYVTVDFATFEDIIDELGGLTVTVQEYEAAYIRKTEKISMPSGENVTLNGKQALLFSRIRKCDSDSDVSRTRRQRSVIMSLINSIKGASLSELMTMLNTLLPYVKTNLTVKEIQSYATQALGYGWLSYEIVQTTINERELFRTGYVGKSSVVFIEFPKAAQKIQNAIYGTTNIVINEGDQTLFSLI